MADKISTIVMKVDLNCHRCYKKISKAICKLTEREKIQTIAFDQKTNTVTISGPFDPKKLCKKLCCKACNVIKDIQIKEDKPKPAELKDKPKETKPAEPKKDKPQETKPAEKPADKPAEMKKDKPKDAKPAEQAEDKPKEAKPAEPKKDKPKEAEPAPEPKKDKPKEAEPAPEPKKDKPKEAKPAEQAEPKKDKPKEAEPAEPKKDKPKDPEPKKNQVDAQTAIPAKAEQVWQPGWAGPGCACTCRPGYEGYYGDYRGCWCGRGGYGGWMPEGPPLPVVYGAPVVYGGYNKSGTFFCEEDPQASCTIM